MRQNIIYLIINFMASLQLHANQIANEKFNELELVPIDSLQMQNETQWLDQINSRSGGDSFGGGDQIDKTKNTAWFYGQKEILVCYHLTENFGIHAEQIENTFKLVIEDWKNYFFEKNIGKNVSLENKINHNFLLKSQCQGNEDLVFYFGTGPIFANLLDLKARQHLDRPSAYVNKTHISRNLKWSKGYIRFVEPRTYKYNENLYYPIWNKDHAFYNFLKHEIGHVLGFLHTPNTIMKQNLNATLFITKQENEKKLTIDLSTELYFCAECNRIYQLSIPLKSFVTSIQLYGHKKVKFLLKDKIVEPKLVNTIYGNDKAPNMLSLFNYKNYEQKIPKLYFLTFENKHFVLEFDFQKATLYENGEIIGRYFQGDF